MSTRSRCERCGAPTSPSRRFCDQCASHSSAVEQAVQTGYDVACTTSAADPRGTELTWVDRSPILGDNVATRQLALVVILSLVLMQALVGTMGLFVDGEFIVLPWFVYAVGGGTLVVLMLVAVLILGNTANTEVTVSDAGLGYVMGARPRRLSRLAILLGAAAGSARTVGAGLLARSRESGFLPWSEVARVRVRQQRRSITLYDDHLPLIEVVCIPELFDEVVAVMERHVRCIDRSP